MRKILLSMALIFAVGIPCSFACSACKITIHGHTYFMNNEDSWRLGSRLWFEPGTDGKMGTAYFGYGDGFPQGGMNEAGLAFDALTVYRQKQVNRVGNPSIGDRAGFVRRIMTSCKTADDVLRLSNQFFRDGFDRGVFFFVDAAGKYAVMEPDTVWVGEDPSYVIANYCPSTTPEQERMAFARYAKGKAFTQNSVVPGDTTLFKRVLDTMHVCRGKLGDGTLHSYIADLSKGTIELFFYHNYSNSRVFNLKDELAKGPHTLDIASLFPGNKEYASLLEYKTVYNSKPLGLFIMGCMALFALVLFMNGIMLVRKKGVQPKLGWTMVVLAALALPMLAKLIMDQGIYYFEFPYNGWWSLYNYLPVLITGCTLYATYLMFRQTNRFRLSVAVNGLAIAAGFVLTGFFVYWKFFPW